MADRMPAAMGGYTDGSADGLLKVELSLLSENLMALSNNDDRFQLTSMGKVIMLCQKGPSTVSGLARSPILSSLCQKLSTERNASQNVTLGRVATILCILERLPTDTQISPPVVASIISALIPTLSATLPFTVEVVVQTLALILRMKSGTYVASVAGSDLWKLLAQSRCVQPNSRLSKILKDFIYSVSQQKVFFSNDNIAHFCSVITVLLQSHPPEASSVCWSLNTALYQCRFDQELVERFACSVGLIPQLLTLIRNNPDCYKHYQNPLHVLTLMIRFARTDTTRNALAVRNDTIAVLGQLLYDHERPQHTEEVCQALATMCGWCTELPTVTDNLLGSGIQLHVIHLIKQCTLGTANTYSLMECLLYAVSTATATQVGRFIDIGIVPLLAWLLSAHPTLPEPMVKLVLHCVDHMLTVSGPQQRRDKLTENQQTVSVLMQHCNMWRTLYRLTVDENASDEIKQLARDIDAKKPAALSAGWKHFG